MENKGSWKIAGPCIPEGRVVREGKLLARIVNELRQFAYDSVGAVLTAGTDAQLLHINEMGSLTPDKHANFVVLDAIPLDTLANVRRI